jgi:hypothetical protein
MPMLRLPASVTSSRKHSNANSNEYQPTEFTLAKFSPDKSVDTPVSRRTPTQSSPSGSQGRSRIVSMPMQKV